MKIFLISDAKIKKFNIFSMKTNQKIRILDLFVAYNPEKKLRFEVFNNGFNEEIMF